MTGVVHLESYNTTVTPVIVISGESTSSVMLDGVAYVSGTPVDAAGVHTLVVSAADDAGNTTSVTVTFTIDYTALDISVSGVVHLGSYNTTVTPVVTITGATESTTTLDGVAYLSGSDVATEGVHTLQVEARNAFGDTETVTVTFTIDTTHPDAIIDTPADGLVTSATVTPSAHSTDPSATLSATLDGVPFTLGSSVATEGVWTLVVTATDPAGNTASDTVTFTIDTTPPTRSSRPLPSRPTGRTPGT